MKNVDREPLTFYQLQTLLVHHDDVGIKRKSEVHLRWPKGMALLLIHCRKEEDSIAVLHSSPDAQVNRDFKEYLKNTEKQDAKE
jgi:hypothetical protein